jgi:hypothetical protein
LPQGLGALFAPFLFGGLQFEVSWENALTTKLTGAIGVRVE